MLRLMVLRHAKSDWGAPFASDAQRPLAPRGERAARSVGRFLAATGRVPDAVITSPAVRARTTVELAAEAGEWSCPVRVSETLYGGSVAAILDEVRQQPVAHARVLIAGHEPTWSTLVATLIGGGEVRMPTAAVACIGFEQEAWTAIASGAGTLRWLVPPRLLGELVSEADDS
jgi:phosphohistidine phosphatase